MLVFIQNCNKKIQCYIVLQPKRQCYIGAATKKEAVCQAAQCSGGLPSVLIILLFLFNMMYSVQFRKKRCHFWFGFVEADQVFSCFLSDRSSHIFKRNIFHGFIPAVVTASLAPEAGQHLCGNFSSSDGKLILSNYQKHVKLM